MSNIVGTINNERFFYNYAIENLEFLLP